jgi:hypothetical protein
MNRGADVRDLDDSTRDEVVEERTTIVPFVLEIARPTTDP